jgi:aerobic-type carbon monoxide dehydrogenase small subunit (CoxS/CutS family)
MPEHPISVTVNGTDRTGAVDDRMTLADFLRERLRLTGTHSAANTASAAPVRSSSTGWRAAPA